MKIVLASSNRGKIKEIKKMCEEHEVFAYSELIDEFEIVEDGNSFKENALIKARAVYSALGDRDAIIIADDSGISVDALDGAPGIYSARYAKEGASDVENLSKLVDALKQKGKDSSKAYYTAAIATIIDSHEYVVHGWMHGMVIADLRGNNGFGYDPCFIPDGFDKTLGELDDSVKVGLSHRHKALGLAKVLLNRLS